MCDEELDDLDGLAQLQRLPEPPGGDQDPLGEPREQEHRMGVSLEPDQIPGADGYQDARQLSSHETKRNADVLTT